MGGRQWASLDRSHQQPQLPQTKQPDSTGAASGADAQDRAQVGRIGERRDLQIAADRHHPQRRNGQRRLPATGPRRIRHLGLLPLPPATFGAFAALVAPTAQGVPRRIAPVWIPVGQHQPRLGMPIAPPRRQRAVQSAVGRGEGRAASPPAASRRPDQRGPPNTPRLTGQPKCAALIDAQKGMPAQTRHPAEPPAGVHAAVGQHQDRPRSGHGRAQEPQHAEPRAPPRPFLTSRQDRPCHRDGAPAIHDAEGQHDQAVAQTGRIAGERQQKISRLQGGQETSVSHVGSLCITFLLNRKLRNDRCVTFSDPAMTLFG